MQAVLLDRLGLVLPKRIRLPEVDVATPTTRIMAETRGSADFYTLSH